MKGKNIFIFMITIVMIFSVVGIKADTPVKRQDPLLAGVLSWYMAGLGQIYGRKYVKGAIFWAVDYTLYISAILTVADISFSANNDIGFGLSIKPKKNLTKKDKTIAISLTIGYVLFHIYNVVDAIKTINNNNAEILDVQNSASIFLDYQKNDENNFLSINYKL